LKKRVLFSRSCNLCLVTTLVYIGIIKRQTALVQTETGEVSFIDYHFPCDEI